MGLIHSSTGTVGVKDALYLLRMAESFSPAALKFLRGLARHNAKPWFETHRAEYEAEVRGPMRGLIEEMDVRFARFAPEMTGDPKRSLFRINRDIRFSKDKSPYKTHAACWFRHRDADHRVGAEAEGGSAGLYFHLEPGASFVGGGIWMPPRPARQRIRETIAEDHRKFARIVEHPVVRRRFGGLSREEMLTRVPRGFAADHPAAEWLRLQSFTVGRELSDRVVLGAGLAARLEEEYRRMMPLVRWLNGILGLEVVATGDRI